MPFWFFTGMKDLGTLKTESMEFSVLNLDSITFKTQKLFLMFRLFVVVSFLSKKKKKDESSMFKCFVRISKFIDVERYILYSRIRQKDDQFINIILIKSFKFSIYHGISSNIHCI
jgi:hypothetical protein